MASGQTNAAAAGGGTIELVRSGQVYLSASNKQKTETFSPGIDAALVGTVLVARGEYNVALDNRTAASLSDDGGVLAFSYNGYGTMSTSFSYIALRIS